MHIRKGFSDESFPGMSAKDLYKFIENKPAWKKKIDSAKRERMKIWEERGMGDETRVPNATIWIFNMKSRFGWSDRQTASLDEELKKIEVTEKSEDKHD